LRRRTLLPQEAHGLAGGDYVELSVSDEGTGIPEDVLPHVFEPFISTKGEAGTGLGLPTCLSIASQLGGFIDVHTEREKGTTFFVLLPAAAELEPAAARAGPERAVRRVLLVDDESSVRATTARLLVSSGYEVTSASTLAEARRMLADPSVPLDAVLTDVVLSGESGTDLLEDCKKLRPALRIVVMSGFTPDPDASRLLVSYGARFLAKPFGREQVLGGAP
jgi:two-component system cell cycle sensor histidine kinase/response regulator CckA